MRAVLLWVLFVIITCLVCGCGDPPHPRHNAEEGLLDLRQWDFKTQGNVTLRGEWRIAFGALLHAEDFDTLRRKTFARVPSDWSDGTQDGKSLPAHGCASYRLRVLLDSSGTPLSIDAPKFIAYKLFVNGVPLGGSGRVACTAGESRAGYNVQVYEDLPESDTLDIVVWISNFQYWKGGFWKPLVLGESDRIREKENRALMLDTVTITALSGLAISMLIFFFSRPSDRLPLFLFLLCAIGVIRTVSTGQLLVMKLIPEISWEWVVSLELMGFYAMGIGWVLMTHQLFPREFPRRQTSMILFLPALFTTACLLLPVRLHSWAVPYMKLYWIGLMAFTLYYYVRILRNRREGAVLFFSAILFSTLGIATEMLYIANVIPLYFPSVLTATVDVLAFIVIIARRSSNALSRIERFSEELEQRVEERTQALHMAQEQLVQREKLAALGQLTAGIAHEIKNPLNFVNNFAAVSSDILEDFPNDVVERDDVAPLLEDLRGNLARIRQHGERADGIIRGMMMHARETTGDRRRVDLHFLIDEAINLSYHSARARLPGFDVSIIRNFDASIPAAELMPQEISRVLINLLSNAIDAVHARHQQSGDGYAPEIRISSARCDGVAEIRIRDNGCGIATEIQDRLFTPFVTTKPAGKGTGLGLSISHDIVVKGHGGTLTLESTGADHSEFMIRIPVSGTDRH